MLLLDYQNVLIQSVLTERFSGAPPVNIDQTVADFDGVTFHISTPESKTKILVSIQVKCYDELVRYGAQQVLEREYGPYVVAPESGYNFSVQVDLESLPEEKEARDDLIRRISLLKRNAMAAPFEHAFDEFHKLQEEASKFTSEEAPQGVREGGDVMAIHYRDEEAIYIKASHDRVTVIFSTVFREETDRSYSERPASSVPNRSAIGTSRSSWSKGQWQWRYWLRYICFVPTSPYSPNEEMKLFPIFKHSVITSITTSKHQRRTSTPECVDVQQTSCKF
ncbi:hypothetical protein EYC84_002841 [Monilinia fructicola]|nr:hypothetical protein EYC84_002841 [Monilinia fructicola]